MDTGQIERVWSSKQRVGLTFTSNANPAEHLGTCNMEHLVSAAQLYCKGTPLKKLWALRVSPRLLIAKGRVGCVFDQLVNFVSDP